MERKTKKIWIGIIITICIVAVIGISYAYIDLRVTGQKKYTITQNGLNVYLDESKTSTDITIEDALPVLDEVGMTNTPYQFALANESPQNLDYTIYLKEDEYENKTPSSAVRYYYTRDVDNVKVIRGMDEQKDENGRIYLETGMIPKQSTYNYTFRMWIDYDAGNEIFNTRYSVHLEIDTIQTNSMYKELALKGTDPVLTDNLVPVKIGADGKVRKASLQDKWYEYGKQEWANAVVLDNKELYAIDEIIPEENIESYFVWIPRYRYRIFSNGNYSGNQTQNPNAPQTIEIEFENKNTELSTGEAVGGWLTHPAFTAFGTNGIWVGKFESGYRGATTTQAAQVDSNVSTQLVIKPNAYSWRSLTVGNMFKTSLDYMQTENSHIMKNTEWGAVAYLSHSKYGKQDENGKNTEVYINNNSQMVTGCGGDTASESSNGTCKNAYGSKADNIYNQSTTGNISGIFDMSGGAYEYVMGYNIVATTTVKESGGITDLYSDFFTNDGRWAKYYDKYNNPSSSDSYYTLRILGDATGEMGPFFSNRGSWYGDYAYFVTPSEPCFFRGNDHGGNMNAGVFNFSHTTGAARGDTSFRVVLAP